MADLQLFGKANLSHLPVWYHFSDNKVASNHRQGLDLLLPEHQPWTEGSVAQGEGTSSRAPPEQGAFLFSTPRGYEPGAPSNGRVRPRPWTRHALVRLPDTNWSKPFSVDSLGVDNGVQLLQKRKQDHERETNETALHLYELGVSVTTHADRRFARTKLISFHSRFVLVNGTRLSLQYRQCDTGMSQTLIPGQSHPYHRFDGDKSINLCLRLQAYGWQWAASKFGLDVGKEGTASVRLRNSHTHEVEVLHVFTKLVDNCYYTTIFPASGVNSMQGPIPGLNTMDSLAPAAANDAEEEDVEADAEPVPYRIENFSLHTLLFHQSGLPDLIQRVLPYHSCPYAWDEPAQRSRLLWLAVARTGNMSGALPRKDQQRPYVIGEYSVDKIKAYPEVVVNSIDNITSEDGRDHKLSVNVYADRKVRVIRVTDVDISMDDLVRTEAHSPLPPFDFEVDFAGVGVSLIQSAHGIVKKSSEGRLAGVESRQELVYLSLQRLSLRVTNSSQTIGLDASIRSIQIDNQLPSATYPVVLRPDESSTTSFRSTRRHFLNLSVVHSHASSHLDFLFFPYFSVRMQKMQLNIEEELMTRLIRFAQAVGTSATALATPTPKSTVHRKGSRLSGAGTSGGMGSGSSSINGLSSSSSSSSSSSASLQSLSAPRSLHSLGGPRRSSTRANNKKIMRRLVLYFQELVIHPIHINISYSTMPSTEDISGKKPLAALFWAVGVTMGNFENASLFLNSLALSEVFASSRELQAQLLRHYVTQGILQLYKILGSSNILGNPVGFFHSISTGVSQFFYEPARGLHSPRAFGSGIARGTSSLLQHSLFGVFNTTSLLLSSVSKGLSSFALAQSDPSSSNANDTAWSTFRNGATGVIRLPVQGFREEGVRGFVKGAVRGAISFVVLPTSGFFNMASNTASSVRNLVNPATELGRARLPRLLQFGVLEPYARFPPHLLHFLTGHFYRNPAQQFLASCTSTEGGADSTLVITSTHLLALSTRYAQGRRRSLKLRWEVPLETVSRVQLQTSAHILRLTSTTSSGTEHHETAIPTSPRFLTALTQQVELVRGVSLP